MDKKTFLIIGSTQQAALELVFSRELSLLGVQNKILPIQNVFLDYYRKNIINKIIYRCGLSFIVDKLQEIIINEINIYKPQVVFVFKGMEIRRSTLKYIRSKGITLLNFNPDSPFIFSGYGSGNKYVKESIDMFDIYFTYDTSIKEGLQKLGVNAELLPFGFDFSGFEYSEIDENLEILKVCFLGNADQLRVRFLNDLASRGLSIDVFGENWSKYKLNRNIKSNNALYGSSFWKTLQNYAVQINLLRPHNISSHNMRSFDIPGAGGVMLAPRTVDHENYFTEDREVFLFSNVDEAYEKAISILNMNFLERNQIRKAARNRSIKEYTYTIRVKTILSYCV